MFVPKPSFRWYEFVMRAGDGQRNWHISYSEASSKIYLLLKLISTKSYDANQRNIIVQPIIASLAFIVSITALSISTRFSIAS